MPRTRIRTRLHIAATTSLVLFALPSGPVQAAPAPSILSVTQSATTIAENRSLSRLTIAQGASLRAPKGSSLTLVVNGVERDATPGSYVGDIELIVTPDVVVPYTGSGPYAFRSAVFVKNGVADTARSVTAAMNGGIVSDGSLAGALIRSKGEEFNGVYATGSGAFAISRSQIIADGNSTNDFIGYGAAIAATDTTKLTVSDTLVRTQGTVRTGLVVAGESDVTLRGSVIDVHNGQLPPGYQFSIIPGKMQEAPYGLGLVGNVRAINLVDKGTLHIENSIVRAQGWGALSTDGAGPTRMFVTDSVIETRDSGYGAYANGDAIDTFRNSVIDAADYALIIGGNGSGTFTNGTIARSRRIGVMMHQGTGGGTLRIDGGSRLESARTAIQVKGRGSTIVIDGAQVVANNGILLQSMENDDPIMKAMAAGGPGGGPGGPGAPPPPGGGDGSPPPPPPGGPISTEVFSPDIKATFAHTQLVGNVYHAMGSIGAMDLFLTDATLEGAVTTSTTRTVGGKDATAQTWYLVGEVENTPAPLRDGKGLSISLDSHSVWKAKGTSYLNRLVLAPGARLVSPSGAPVSITVDGKTVRPVAGTYTGAIVVTSPDAPLQPGPAPVPSVASATASAAPPPPPPASGQKLDMSEFAAAIDTNHDGKLSRAEWDAQKLPITSFNGFENGRGYVTIEDYQNKPAPPGIDMNGDGKLSIAEFVAFDKRMQNAPPPSP